MEKESIFKKGHQGKRMDIPNLVELVKSYKDNEEVTAKIFFKNGRTESIKDIDFSGKELILNDGEILPDDMISHAEIFAM